MALESVLPNDLHQVEEDNERVEADIDDADLEEGEIADDDDDVEDVKNVTSKPVENTVEKKEESTPKNNINSNGPVPQERGEVAKSNSADKRRERDKRPARNRKRNSEDELPDYRDSNRKRRRTQDDGKEDVLDADGADFEMTNVRGHSQDRIRFDSAGSDYEDSGVAVRRNRTRPTRTSPPRRRNRGSSRERPDRGRRGERERNDRNDRRGSTKSSTSAPTSMAAKVKEESLCAFYMEGKCSRGADCPYSHAALPPRKMELCKFYLMDCCAKKEKCLYLHKDFPCKFFHTGRKCRSSAEDCKFSHNPLSETTTAILIKHIETAPREILGDFPRLTREETIQAIENYSPQPNGREKRAHIPSLYENQSAAGGKAEGGSNSKEHNNKMPERINESGSPPTRRIGFYQETVEPPAEVEISRSPEGNSRSIWFGQLRQDAADVAGNPESKKNEAESADANPVDYLSTLPARQRQLYLRIQQQQREPSSIAGDAAHPEDEKAADDKWYSSDEEDNGGGKSDLSKSTRNAAESSAVKDSSGSVSVGDLNLSSLENINVAEIAKVLSTLKQDTASSTPEDTPPADGGRRDPRMRDPRMRLQPQPSNMGDVDHRVPPVRQDVDLRVSNNRISSGDTDLRSGLAPLSSNLDEIGSSDIDLRRLPLLPFKPVVAPAYSSSAAMEIEASHDSHPPIEYIVYVVDYIPLDYSQIRVHADWSHLDPRQQKSHVTVRDFTSSDPPSIPLSGNFSGPVSPDPPAPSPRQYDPPEAAPYPAVRSAPNDPRARDPRRAAAAERQASSPGGSIPDPRGKPGLLGAAPPGMVPLKGKTDVVLPVENRRDPRQRLRTLAAGITQSPQRSYTPPLNERDFC